MYYREFDINDYELIWAYRPIYNKSEELFPQEKKIRPFFVIKNFDDNRLLVSGLTTKKHHNYNYKIADDSYISFNDFYIISKRDVTKGGIILPKHIVDIFFKKSLLCIKRNEILYGDEIKQLFLAISKEYFLQKNNNIFNSCDIIALYDLSNKKYIIDKVQANSYWAYRIVSDKKDDNDYAIDFSSGIRLEKEKKYLLHDTMDIDFYKNLKEKELIRINEEKNQNNNINKHIITSGSIVKYDDKEYFVIYVTGTGKYLCVPYLGNYLLDNIISVNKNEIKFVKQLPLNDTKVILKTIYNNVYIQLDNNLKNKLYMKILDYK